MGLRNQTTSTASFERTPFGLKASVTLPNGFVMETMTWETKRDVINNCVSICRANRAVGRLIISAGTRQQEVFKL